ncbi:unnamed protein product [Calypogeia fissa]
MSSIGDDVEEVGPEEHPVSNLADGSVWSDVSRPKDNFRVDTEIGDVITEGEATFLSISSSGDFTSCTELAQSVAAFPAHLSPEGLAGHRIGGQEYAVMDANISSSTDGKDTPIAVQFASPEVVAGQDDNLVDSVERVSSPGERLGFVSSSPPTHSSGVEFEYTAVVGDHVVAVDRSSPLGWPTAASEGHDAEVAYSAEVVNDNCVATEEQASPQKETSAHLCLSPAAGPEDNDNAVQERASSPCERSKHLDLPPLLFTTVVSSPPASDADADSNAIQEPESSWHEIPESVPPLPHPYTITAEFASPTRFADGECVSIQEPASSSYERAADVPSSLSYTMAVEFASPAIVPCGSDVPLQERESSECEGPADVPSPRNQHAMVAEFASPPDDVAFQQDRVADQFGPSASVSHYDVEDVQAVLEVASTSSVRENDGAVVQDTIGVDSASPAVVPEGNVAVVQEFTSPAAFGEGDILITEEKMAVEFPSPAVPTDNDDPVVVKETVATELSAPDVGSNEDFVVIQHTVVVKPVSFRGEDVVVVEETVGTEFSSRASVPDDNALLVQDTGAIELTSAVAGDDDAVTVHDELTVGFVPSDVPRDGSVLLLDAMAIELDCAVVVGDKDVAMEEAMAVKPASPPQDIQEAVVQRTMAVEFAYPAVTDDDIVVVQEQDSSLVAKSRSVPSPPFSSEIGAEVASSAVDFDKIAVDHERASSSYAGSGNASSSAHILVDNEGYRCRETDGSSYLEQSASVSFPVVSPVPVAEVQEEQVLDGAVHSEALEELPPHESPKRPGGANLSSMNGSEGVSTFHISENPNQGKHDTVDEQQPAKRAKTSGAMYSGADAIAVVLGQTAEIILVLAGMAQMRAGRMPTSYERELAATAFQNLGILVSQVAPNNLVAKDSLEKMLQEYNLKKSAQKKREDQAWIDALTEAEALANARAESLARAKAEAAARAQAEAAARAQAEAAARAQAEELERRQQAAMKAAIIGADGPGKGGFSSPLGGSRLTSDQSACRVSELAQSASLPAPAVHPTSQIETGSHVLSPVSKAGEIPRLVFQTEKTMSVNGQPLTPASKPTLGRPPKVRNRVRKEPATVTLFTPEFLNVVQGQASDPQKAHFTHKQLCLGVQQFIRDHVPPVSQILQALPPTYISTPFPCQVCKLIAKDTGSVLVCDSCDEVSHVKCVQPPSSRGASKGDWNCPKCLTASRGGKCPSKYGPIRHGSPNSVKLWPPHDVSQGNNEPIRSISNGSASGEGDLATIGRQIGSGLSTVQGKAGLEIDTRANQNIDDPSTGNFGSSPHLIVHLVSEPSPRTNHPLRSSSHSLLQENNQGPVPSGKSIPCPVQETSIPKVVKNVAYEDKTHLQGKTGMTMSGQNDNVKIPEGDGKVGKGVEKSDSRSSAVVVEDSVLEVKHRRATPAHTKKTETRTQAIHSKKGTVHSGTASQSKQAEVPLPIVMEWVGESIRKAEGKLYYRACSVGGITFSVSDCALFRPETPDVPPYIARLQVLWEDIATGHKWVRVSWCYYPTDIPLAMGRPGTTAADEVYESNHCDNNLVGSIQGPCFVLPPLKFIEEKERRRTLKQRGDPVEELPPIFLSRWMYDAPKGVFRPL